MITTPQEAFGLMGSPYGMPTKQIMNLMKRHLKEWRPKEYQRLVEENRILTRTEQAAKRVQRGLRLAREQGLPFLEEQERLLKQYILLPPEKEVLEEMEREENEEPEDEIQEEWMEDEEDEM